VLKFKKSVSVNRDNTIKDSDINENDLIFISAEKILTFLKLKILSLITLKPVKH
ncbi:hypothetical protein BDFG_09440, partial [Blastomyces dermatitidis ATCC 26199]